MSLRDVVQQYGIRFKKSLGQNLLLDENINRIMIDAAALTPDDDIMGVGAGLGALTSRLAERAKRVLAIEIDRAFLPVLEDRFREVSNVILFRGDILNHRVEKLVQEYLPGGASYKMVSNLPYYITTPVLFHFWESSIPFERVVVMVQQEVAERMTAPVNNPEYGVLSIASSLYAQTDIVHVVPRTCFRPQPKVDSCIVRMRRRDAPLVEGVEPRFFMSVVRAAFAQRRKTLRNALTRQGLFGAPKAAVLEAFEAAGIHPERRAQTVSIQEFAHLAGEIRRRL
ncbi:MAG: ribosomal RNA small subunit methyltransferase A [Candidatus Hydrogenedentota bacterium]